METVAEGMNEVADTDNGATEKRARRSASGRVRKAASPPAGQSRKKRLKKKEKPAAEEEPWTAEEHQRFLVALEKYGSMATGKEWQNIATYVGKRSTAECWRHAEKYLLRLQSKRVEGLHGVVLDDSPSFESGKWSWDENKLFENLLVKFPINRKDRYEKIAAAIPGKSVDQIKNRYKLLIYDISKISSGEDVTLDFHVPARS